MRGQSNIGAAKAPIRMSVRNKNGVGVRATDFMCTPLTTIVLDKYDVGPSWILFGIAAKVVRY